MRGLETLKGPTPAPQPDARPVPASALGPIAYHTTDDVNRAVLVRLAGLFRIPVEHTEPRDRPATAEVLVYDADFWWDNRTERDAGLRDLIAKADGRVIAVHGWTLDDEQLDRLRASGVIAQTRLNFAFVSLIARVLRGR
jgi:hypothetical protein